MKISLTVLLVALALAASSQSDCLVNQQDVWTRNNQDVSVQCDAESSDNPSWWAVQDPCRADSSGSTTSLNQCSGRGSCTVESSVYGANSSCVVCCNSGATFSPDTILSCSRIKVCPEVHVEVPSLVKTGSRVEVLTFVLTKPPPPAGIVSVTAMTASNRTPLAVEGDGNVYPVPMSRNTYVFAHVVEMPKQKGSVDDRVLFTINRSMIPTSSSCPHESTIVRSIPLVEVNDSATTASPSTQTTSTADTTATGSSISGLMPEPSRRLDMKSILAGIGIGLAVGVFGTLLAVAVVKLLVSRSLCTWCCREKAVDSSRSRHSSGTGGERPLLTSNGTPATTPSSDVQRTLGQTSDSTPASTPTDPNDLLLTQPLQTNADPSPYEEVTVNQNFQTTVLNRQRVITNVPPMGNAPPPQEPAPPPPDPPAPSFRPNPPRMEQSGGGLLQSSAPPEYLAQQEMVMYLSSNRNNGELFV